jgi:hypothetical protein
MFSLRDVVIFLAGAEFLHTISHILLLMTVPLPLDFKFIVLTPSLNMGAIVCNAVITVVLLIWAAKLSKK